ncbi:hypothetical protein ATANTOWER_015186 [Ataeniobius toweri]|uniref:Uncharacterized protein n=1 Tax=Ataeniobius toweri TaxID=208326 RepID=A0ABU7AG46_9TELE|nr:hypothetical protein [Ataeniobius toweri]
MTTINPGLSISSTTGDGGRGRKVSVGWNKAGHVTERSKEGLSVVLVQRERAVSRLLHEPTLNNKTDSGLRPTLGLDQSRSDQNDTAGQDWVLFQQENKKEKPKNRGDIAHTRAAGEPEGTQP